MFETIHSYLEVMFFVSTQNCCLCMKPIMSFQTRAEATLKTFKTATACHRLKAQELILMNKIVTYLTHLEDLVTVVSATAARHVCTRAWRSRVDRSSSSLVQHCLTTHLFLTTILCCNTLGGPQLGRQLNRKTNDSFNPQPHRYYQQTTAQRLKTVAI
jgi:hypothetical protein